MELSHPVFDRIFMYIQKLCGAGNIAVRVQKEGFQGRVQLLILLLQPFETGCLFQDRFFPCFQGLSAGTCKLQFTSRQNMAAGLDTSGLLRVFRTEEKGAAHLCRISSPGQLMKRIS